MLTISSSPPSNPSPYSRRHPLAGPSRFTVADCSQGTSLFTHKPNSHLGDFSGCLLASVSASASASMASSFRSSASAFASSAADEDDPGAFLNSPYTSSSSSAAATKPKVAARVIEKDPSGASAAWGKQKRKNKEKAEEEAKFVEIPLRDGNEKANPKNGDLEEEGWVKVPKKPEEEWEKVEKA